MGFSRGRFPIALKVFALLLAIALVPIALISRLDLVALRELGRSLAGRTRDALVEDVRQGVLLWIEEKAVAVRARRHLLARTVLAQAREAERCLASPSNSQARVFWTDDLDRGRVLPPGIEVLPRYRQFEASSGAEKAVPVSFAEQAFHLSPGLSRSRAVGDAARLAPLSAAYRFLRANDPALILLQYTGLESGLFSTYPGHGGFPADYDPRQRAWYQAAARAGTPVIHGPYVSATLRELVFTFAAPVRRADGSLAGVTGIDVLLDDLVRNIQLPTAWPRGATVMLLQLTTRNGAPSATILARPGVSAKGHPWHRDYEPERLEDGPRTDLGRVLDEMARGTSATTLIPWNGRPCLWGYGPVDGEGLFLLVVLPQEEITLEATRAERDAIASTRDHLRRLALLTVGVIGAVIAAAWAASRTFSRPIRELADATRGVAEGNFEARVRLRTRDEIGELGAAFNRMVPQLQDRLRIKQSLELAREVQQSLLPAAPPQVPGLDVAGRSVYCDETGGDYYDFLVPTGRGRARLGIVIGDVTGHGIASAMLMATARALLRAGGETAFSLGDVMTRLNQHLVGDVSGGRFMTLFHLAIDAELREARWVSAGHDPAIHWRTATASFGELAGDGPPLGIDPGQTYREHGPLALEMGDVVVVGTDGLWEARDPAGRAFGKEALRETIRCHASESSGEIADAVIAEIARFRGNRPQADDLTLVVAKVTPLTPGARTAPPPRCHQL